MRKAYELSTLLDKIATVVTDVPPLSDEAVSRAGIYADHSEEPIVLEPGSRNYTEERRALLPDWDVSTLIQKAAEVQEVRKTDG